MIKIGLVGIGGMGTVHYNNYLHIEDCKVTAVVGQSEADYEKAGLWKLPIYESIEEMAAKEELTVIDICTPTYMHREHAMTALSLDKHVICEKPLALNIEDARKIFSLAKEKKKQVFVGQVLRFYKENLILKELVESGQYGKVLDVQMERLSACPRWAQGGWLFDREKSGHLPFDLHIHDLDLMVSIFGKPESFTYKGCGNKGRGYREHYRFNYNYKDFNVSAEAAWFNADIPFTAGWRVYFENAVLFNKSGTLTAYTTQGEPKVFDIEDRIKIPTGINLPPTGVFLEELKHFTDCIKGNRPSELITEEQILQVMDILTDISRDTAE